MEKYQRIWDDAIDRLKSNISQQSFDMFFSTPKKVYKVKNNKMYVVVQNNHEQFMLDKFYLKEGEKMEQILNTQLFGLVTIILFYNIGLFIQKKARNPISI